MSEVIQDTRPAGFDAELHDAPPPDCPVLGDFALKGEGYISMANPNGEGWVSVRKKFADEVDKAVRAKQAAEAKEATVDGVLEQLNLKPAPPKKEAPAIAETIQSIAESLGLRRAYSVKDRAADVFSSWVAFDGAPVFIVELSDEDRAHHKQELVEIARARITVEKAPEFPDDAKPEDVMGLVEAALDEKVKAADALVERDAALSAWVLERTWRGSPLVDDWRDFYPSMQQEIARLIVQKSTLGRVDSALF